MPFISFTPREALRGKVVSQPDWYRLKIEDIGEEPSKDKQSTNYPVSATVIKNAENGSVDDAGVPIDWNFNSKAIGFAKGFLESLGVEVKPDVRFDLGAAKGMEIEVLVEHDTYQGRTVNRVNHKYRPTPETQAEINNRVKA